MKDEFSPPIKSRTTNELLEIASAPEKWDTNAVNLAEEELIIRNVNQEKMRFARLLTKKREQIAASKRANTGYRFLDFISDPFPTLFEILFSWGLKRDGFIKKARQQKIIRISIGLIILIVFSYLKLKLKNSN